MSETKRRSRGLGISLLVSLGIGCAAVLLSIGLANLPNFFNPREGAGFSENLPLTRFLGNALQSLLILLILVLSIRRVFTYVSSRLLLVGWAAVALLAVAAPSPSIINGAYGDTLAGVFAIATGVLAAGYSFHLMFCRPVEAKAR